MMKIFAFETVDMMNAAVVDAIRDRAAFAIRHHQSFHIALAGGGTPKSIYELMAREPHRSVFPWDKMHFYFGDERCVPAGHADSNYRMAWLALLSKIPVPPKNVHPIAVDLQDIPASARHYEYELKRILPRIDSAAAFDLVLLGIGDDGHTASLFPGTEILEESGRWVAAVYVKKFDAWRISLTYPIINAAAAVFVIAAGAGKSRIISEVLSGKSTAARYPVQGIRPAGELVWYLDAPAAGLLPPGMVNAAPKE